MRASSNPTSTRDLLLRGAERYLYQVRWSDEIVAEMRDSLVRNGRVTSEQSKALTATTLKAFPEAMVDQVAEFTQPVFSLKRALSTLDERLPSLAARLRKASTRPT